MAASFTSPCAAQTPLRKRQASPTSAVHPLPPQTASAVPVQHMGPLCELSVQRVGAAAPLSKRSRARLPVSSTYNSPYAGDASVSQSAPQQGRFPVSAYAQQLGTLQHGLGDWPPLPAMERDYSDHGHPMM